MLKVNSILYIIIYNIGIFLGRRNTLKTTVTTVTTVTHEVRAFLRAYFAL